jgi:two-component sensor histidine kinase
MHHRLKNNLQVISSLLSIQSDFVKDEESHKLFINSLNRIRAMSLTHENLKRESNFTDIQFDKYVRDLVTFLCRNYNINTNLLKIIIKIPSVSLPIDTSITCGLIINELISNSLKHAFPGGKSGNIKIGLEKLVKQHKLFVSDNGIGLPDKMDIEKDNSFGLLLIRTLVDQLNGKLEVISENGSKFIIRFPNSSF